MGNYIKLEFLDIINYSICRAVDEYLSEGATEFFKRIGEQPLRRGIKGISLRWNVTVNH